jgi:DNA-binding PadR family transcriptional regulator
MRAPLFILGFLMREGPLHGYRIQQLIEERASDVARIKLPTIYYHLEQLQKKAYVRSHKEKEGRRPDRFVYEITSQGQKHFRDLLAEALQKHYRAEFDLDAALFFRDALDDETLDSAIQMHAEYLKGAVQEIKKHRRETLESVPEPVKPMVKAIFSHHLVHYSAELRWIRAVRLELFSPGRFTD